MSGGLRRVLLPLVPAKWRRAARLERRLREQLGYRVQAGPFEGMQYVDRSFTSAYWPKLLGTYELELHDAIEAVVAARTDLVLVLGAAEGYYAVGLAKRLPDVRVVAWEANPEARAVARELARLNNVEGQVELRGIGEAGELERAATGARAPLLIVDIDGAEAVLIDPEIVPALRRSTILVEVHDCFVPGSSALLGQRFQGSHRLLRVEARRRDVSDAPDLGVPRAFLGALEQLLSERRPVGNDWLVMVPRQAT